MKTTLYIIASLLLLTTASCNRTKVFEEYQDKITTIANSEQTSDDKVKQLNILLKEISNRDIIKNKKDRAKLAGVCLNSIGNQYEKQAKYDISLNYYDRAIESDSTNGKIYHNRGYIHMLLVKPDKAKSDFSRAIELVPDHAPTYNNLGVLYMNNEYNKALGYLNKAIELDPGYLDAYSNRSTVYANLRQYDKSIEDNNYVLGKDPNYLRAYLERGIVYLETNDYDKALADLNAALRIDSLNPYVLYNKGELYYRMKEYDKAMVELTKALDADPDGQVGKAAMDRMKNVLSDYGSSLIIDEIDD